MKTFAATLLLTAFGLAQGIGGLNRHADGSCGGILTDDRGEMPFHLAVTDYRRLMVPVEACARKLAPP